MADEKWCLHSQRCKKKITKIDIIILSLKMGRWEKKGRRKRHYAIGQSFVKPINVIDYQNNMGLVDKSNIQISFNSSTLACLSICPTLQASSRNWFHIWFWLLSLHSSSWVSGKTGGRLSVHLMKRVYMEVTSMRDRLRYMKLFSCVVIFVIISLFYIGVCIYLWHFESQYIFYIFIPSLYKLRFFFF